MSGNWRIYRKLEPGEFIVIGADTAAGGVDYCAAQFISTTRKDVPIVYHAKQLASDMTPELIRMMIAIYTDTKVKPTIAYERNNGGVFEIERLHRHNAQNCFSVYRTKTDRATVRGTQQTLKFGWETNAATRPAMLADLKDAIDNELFTFYDEHTLRELLSFVVVQTNSSWKAQAENGMHDDLVMALAIAWQLYLTEQPEKEKRSGIARPKLPGPDVKQGYLVVDNHLQYNFNMEKALRATTKSNKDWRHM